MIEFRNDELGSEFEYESEVDREKKKREDFAVKKGKLHISKGTKEIHDIEQGKIERSKQKYMAMDAYSRHKNIINNYFLCYKGSVDELMKRDESNDRTDSDVIRENIQFLYDSESDIQTWEQKLAKRYYDKLFKEYAICDLTFYKENKVAMRWCTEKEVVNGKGQFICGNKKCKIRESLTSWEINFAYIEHEIKKNALVKLRLCQKCAAKLNYHKKRKQVFKKPKKSKKHGKNLEEGKIEEIGESSSSKKVEENNEESKPVLMTKEKESELWTQKPIETEKEKSRDEEFQDFLEDMFL